MLNLARYTDQRIMLANQRFILQLKTLTYGTGVEAAVIDWLDTADPDHEVKSYTLPGPRRMVTVCARPLIEVCLVRLIRKDQAELGIEAPEHVDIQREELLTRGRAA